MPLPDAPARAWLAGAWVCLAILAGAAALCVRAGVVVCDATLASVPEPSGWRDWPLADAEELRVEGDALTGRGVCPHAAVSLAAWRSANDGTHALQKLWLRRDGGVFVVASVPRTDESPNERFLVAFRRSVSTRLAFVSRRAAAAVLIVGLALALLFTGILFARRQLRRVGERARPIVRMLTAPESYRHPPTSSAEQVLDGTRDSLGAAQRARAVRAIRLALLGVAALLAVGLVVAGYVE